MFSRDKDYLKIILAIQKMNVNPKLLHVGVETAAFLGVIVYMTHENNKLKKQIQDLKEETTTLAKYVRVMETKFGTALNQILTSNSSPTQNNQKSSPKPVKTSTRAPKKSNRSSFETPKRFAEQMTESDDEFSYEEQNNQKDQYDEYEDHEIYSSEEDYRKPVSSRRRNDDQPIQRRAVQRTPQPKQAPKAPKPRRYIPGAKRATSVRRPTPKGQPLNAENRRIPPRSGPQSIRNPEQHQPNNQITNQNEDTESDPAPEDIEAIKQELNDEIDDDDLLSDIAVVASKSSRRRIDNPDSNLPKNKQRMERTKQIAEQMRIKRMERLKTEGNPDED